MILISSIFFCFTLCDAISEWGENFMIAHPVYKFEELEVTNSKHYQKSTNWWTSVHGITSNKARQKQDDGSILWTYIKTSKLP